MRRNVLLVACVVAAAVIVSLGVRLAVGRLDDSVERIREEAMRFTGRDAIDLEPVTDGVFSDVPGLSEWVDTMTGDEFIWNRAGGYFFGYTSVSAHEPNTGSMDIGEDRARAIAAAWAKRCYGGGSLDGMSVECMRKVEGSDPAMIEYLVEYRRFVSGIRTFDYIAICVNGSTGKVMTVDQQCGPLSVGLSPKVGADEAALIASRVLNVPAESCSERNLEVVSDPQGRQHLVWVVEFGTGDEETGGLGTAVVDAHSGKVLDSGTSW